MNWTGLIISAVSIIVTGLATWAMGIITKWLNDRLANKKSLKYANDILEIVTTSVKKTYQTYVESIKGTDAWTQEAQQKALEMALSTAEESINMEMAQYIATNYGDVNNYLTDLIHAVLYDLKK